MKNSFINKIVRDEIDNIDALDSERDLIYKLLDFERRLANLGKTRYMEDYRRGWRMLLELNIDERQK